MWFLLGALFVVWRFIYPLHLPAAIRVATGAIAIFVSQLHLVSEWVFGTMFSPEVPTPLALLGSWAVGAFVLFTLLLGVIEVGGLINAVRIRSVRATALWKRARWAAFGIAVLLAVWGLVQAVALPSVRRIEVPIAALPAELDGVRVVQLSDLHVSKLLPRAWVQAVVARTNELKPDILLLTGDVIDGFVTDRQEDVAPLQELSAQYGVFVSPGNHEYYFDWNAWQETFKLLGIRILDNDHVVVKIAGQHLVFAGVADPVATKYDFDGPLLGKALKGVDASSPIVLLNHRPIDLTESAAAGVDLQLSGHTHGGMVKGIDLLIRHLNDGYVSGMYQVDGGMSLYVSNGAGIWNGFAMRLGIPSEITEFTLKALPIAFKQ